MKSNITYLMNICNDIQSCHNDCFQYSFIDDENYITLKGMSAEELPSSNTWHIRYTTLSKTEGFSLSKYVSYNEELFTDYLKYKQRYYNFLKMEFVPYNDSNIFNQKRMYKNGNAQINLNNNIKQGQDCFITRQYGGDPYLFLIIY